MLKKIIITHFLISVLALSFVQPALAMRQAEMERVLHILEHAENALKQAKRHKGEHKDKALLYVKKAMLEVREEIEFSNRRPAGGHYKKNK